MSSGMKSIKPEKLGLPLRKNKIQQISGQIYFFSEFFKELDCKESSDNYIKIAIFKYSMHNTQSRYLYSFGHRATHATATKYDYLFKHYVLVPKKKKTVYAL